MRPRQAHGTAAEKSPMLAGKRVAQCHNWLSPQSMRFGWMLPSASRCPCIGARRQHPTSPLSNAQTARNTMRLLDPSVRLPTSAPLVLANAAASLPLLTVLSPPDWPCRPRLAMLSCVENARLLLAPGSSAAASGSCSSPAELAAVCHKSLEPGRAERGSRLSSSWRCRAACR